MTLREWLDTTPVVVQPIGDDGAKQVFVYPPSCSAKSKWDLYHLSDYVVSSHASGPSLILVPRTERS